MLSQTTTTLTHDVVTSRLSSQTKAKIIDANRSNTKITNTETVHARSKSIDMMLDSGNESVGILIFQILLENPYADHRVSAPVNDVQFAQLLFNVVSRNRPFLVQG